MTDNSSTFLKLHNTQGKLDMKLASAFYPMAAQFIYANGVTIGLSTYETAISLQQHGA